MAIPKCGHYYFYLEILLQTKHFLQYPNILACAVLPQYFTTGLSYLHKFRFLVHVHENYVFKYIFCALADYRKFGCQIY